MTSFSAKIVWTSPLTKLEDVVDDYKLPFLLTEPFKSNSVTMKSTEVQTLGVI